MKHLRTFENLEKIENEQYCRLAIIKFSSEVIRIFKDFYNIQFNLEEVEANYRDLRSFSLFHLREDYNVDVFCHISINYNFSIMVHFYGWKMEISKEFMDFVDQFFDVDMKYHKIITFNYKELNNFTKRIYDEFEMFKNIKKYNL